jgi:uncharacterized protein YjbI with pentapeptide repeats
MDHDEELKLLKGGTEGIAEWNRRREAGEELWDLSGANLNGANLSGADLSSAFLSGANLSGANLRRADLSGAFLSDAFLSGADLRRASLSGANLSGANLSDANLSGASLSGANLSGANLKRADLSDADLSDANLGDANLSGANLKRADLSGASLSGASCGSTVVANVDLSDAKGLDSVRHHGPSTVGIDTILRSKGNIPEAFLRGCGVPETLIEYLPSLIGSMQPIQFYSCFISYSSKNQAFSERLYADLRAKGVLTWFDQEHLKIGDKIRPRINEAIRVHDKLMLVLSEESIASDWVEGEVEAALERERREKRTVLFPIRLDDSVMETPVAWASHIRQNRHIGDFREWENHGDYQKAFDRLLRDLKSDESTGAKNT